MSQHIVKASLGTGGGLVWIQLGWDKPLSEFYMVIFEDVPGAEHYDEGRVIYSNELDPNGSRQGLDYFMVIASMLGCDIPRSLWVAAEADKALNVVNRTVFYSRAGEVIESPWSESD
ncbi:hypothetical protein SJI00_20775 [Pseudomonas sp. RP23018S]|uniref:hypothetical protein n=1 Tax=Pseudomonas sp. RP23018S TaxID=3096037 RepID=UPI002ACA7C25|nr:hypothetical protein [Pseudomonas sp. RP23018S]MDZ5605210.1 hypothetical protein [Pseudomonas sp. RP23018S]